MNTWRIHPFPVAWNSWRRVIMFLFYFFQDLRPSRFAGRLWMAKEEIIADLNTVSEPFNVNCWPRLPPGRLR